jgi:hypothetical protein
MRFAGDTRADATSIPVFVGAASASGLDRTSRRTPGAHASPHGVSTAIRVAKKEPTSFQNWDVGSVT